LRGKVMSYVESHPPGSFCWIELATSNQAAAKTFYTSLFGWSATDSPMAPGEVYTMFRLNDRDVGGGYTLRAEQVAMGAPPHWMVYVAVANADDTVAKAKELGGTVLAPAFDVFDIGRMAVLQDPTGAVFSIWQAMKHHGMGVVGVDGAYAGWADLSSPEPERAGKFYSALFSWQLLKGEDDPESGYLHIKNGEHFIGGVQGAEQRDPHVPPHWLIYFHTSDCDASTGKVTALGGKTCFGPMTLEKVGRFSVVADPQGAAFALFQPMPHTN